MYPEAQLSFWTTPQNRILNPALDWGAVERDYIQNGITIVDGFFSDAALADLWAYALEAPCFRTVRQGFLGASTSLWQG